jgi:hypothetical protein
LAGPSQYPVLTAGLVMAPRGFGSLITTTLGACPVRWSDCLCRPRRGGRRPSPIRRPGQGRAGVQAPAIRGFLLEAHLIGIGQASHRHEAVEADLVTHSGPRASGSFICTLVLTDIATGWTECAPLLVREQKLLTEVLTELRKLTPTPLLGFDTDNDAVFMNETVRDYCVAEGIAFTRCRPYRKNDQAWVEQKNGAVVRRIVGYRRFEGLEAAAALARLYATVRLFVNFFQPSFKLAEKARDGARVKKRYHPAATPFQRLLADTRVAVETKEQARAIHTTLDPVALLREMRAVQQHLVEIVDKTLVDQSKLTTPTLEQFLSGLRTAWKEGEVRPTARPHPNCAVGPIHSRQSMVSCANGSRPSHGGRQGSYWSVCNRNTQASIRTSYCGHCSAG